MADRSVVVRLAVAGVGAFSRQMMQSAQAVQDMSSMSTRALVKLGAGVGTAVTSMTRELNKLDAKAAVTGRNLHRSMSRQFQLAITSSAAGVVYRAIDHIGAGWKALGRTIDGVSGFTRKALTELGKNHQYAARTIGLGFLAASAALSGGFALSVKSAVQFETVMNNVNSISYLSGAQLKSLSRDVIQLSTTLPQSATEMAKGLYDIASAGKFGAEGFEILKASARAASAGLSDTQTSAQAIIAVLNAYGFSADRAAYVSDVLFQTVRVGVITFQELTQQLGDFVAYGAIAHVPLEQLGIALSAITRAGVPAAEASTSLNRVLQALIKPSAAMTAQLKALGYESGASALEQKGLTGVIEELRLATGGQITTIQKLFPEIRAARGAYALMAANGQVLNQTMREFGDSGQIAGATARALAEQQKSLSFQWAQAKNSITAFGIALAQYLLPSLKAVAQFLASLGQGLTSLPGPVKAIVTGLGGFVLVLTAVIGVAALMAPRLAAVATAMAAMGVQTSAIRTIMSVSSIAMAGFTAALTIGAIVLARYAKKKAEARAAAEAHLEALKQERAGVVGVTDAMIAGDLEKKGILKALNTLGIDSTLAVKSVEGVTGSIDQLATSLLAAIPTTYIEQGTGEISKMSDNAGILAAALHGSSFAYSELSAMLGNADQLTDKQRAFLKVVKEVGSEYRDHASAVQALIRLDAAQAKATDDQGSKFANLKSQLVKTADATAEVDDVTKSLNKTFEAFVSPADAYKDAVKLLPVAADLTDIYSEALDRAKSAAKDESAASKNALTQRIRNAQDAARAASRAVAGAPKGLKALYRASAQAAQDHVRELERARQDAGRAGAGAVDDVKLSVAEFTDELDRKLKIQRDRDTALTRIARLGGQEFADVLRAGGDKAADTIALLATATDTQIRHIADSYSRLGPQTGQSFDEWANMMARKQAQFLAFQANLQTLALRGFSYLATKIADMGVEAGSRLAADAVTRNDKTLGAMTQRLSNAEYEASVTYADQQKKILSLFDTLASSAGTHLDFDTLAGNVGLSVDEMVAAFGTLGHKIDLLPKDVRIQVTAFVQGQEALAEFARNLNAAITAHARAIHERLYEDISAPPPTPVPPPARAHISFNAAGSFERHVASYGGRHMRVWNEPETGGEAYIPLGLAKRSRSLGLLGDVAAHFGMSMTPMGAGALGPRSQAHLGVSRGATGGVEVRQITYQFTGDIKAPDLSAVAREAQRRQRLSAAINP